MDSEQQPRALYTAEQIKKLDQYAIENGPLSGYELMQRAAGAVVRLLRFRWPKANCVTIVCGSGNNGGDGFVVARMLMSRGFSVKVGLVGDSKALRNDAKRAFDQFRDSGGTLLPVQTCIDSEADVIVDALFGNGLSRLIEGEAASIVSTINQSATPVIAVDVPSGLCSTSGAIRGCAVRATVTLTFIGCKQGMHTGSGPDCCGELFFDSLGLTDDIYASVNADVNCISAIKQLESLPRRAQAFHKGNCGHVLFVGGNIGFSGALHLAARACLRTGAGRVTVACHRQSIGAMADTPELMTCAIDHPGDIAAHIGACDVIGIGPGLGTDQWARELLKTVLESHKPLVIDADALNLISENPKLLSADCVLTPHPAEAARLLGIETRLVQQDRFAAIEKLYRKYNANIVLKGNGTLIKDSQRTCLVNAGNAGMASAGMGDVLTGIISSFIGQGLSPYEAAVYGTTLHAQAGDLAADNYGNGLVASDVIESSRLLLCQN